MTRPASRPAPSRPHNIHGHLLELQATAGNQAVTAAVQRWRPTGHPAPKGKRQEDVEQADMTFVGLKQGDGMETEGGNPDVAMLQQVVNTVVDTSAGAPLITNGKWDSTTTAYVQELQVTVGEPQEPMISPRLGPALRKGAGGLADLRDKNQGKEPAMGPNPLIGLKRGTGVDMPQGDQRVAYLQQQLNGVVDTTQGAALTTDGKWDDTTDAYVKAVQDAVSEPASDEISQPFGTALDQGPVGLKRLRDLRRFDPPTGGPPLGAPYGKVVASGGFQPGPVPEVPDKLDDSPPPGAARLADEESADMEPPSLDADHFFRLAARLSITEPLLRGVGEVASLIETLEQRAVDAAASAVRSAVTAIASVAGPIGTFLGACAGWALGELAGDLVRKAIDVVLIPARLELMKLWALILGEGLKDSNNRWLPFTGQVYEAMKLFGKIFNWIKEGVAVVKEGPARLLSAAKQNGLELVGLKPTGFTKRK